MKNKIVITVILIGIILMILVAILFIKNKPSESIPKESTMLLPSKKSKDDIIVNNYYQDPRSEIIDEKDVVIEKNEAFDILAYDYNNKRTFLIYLYNRGSDVLEANRQAAEKTLMERLNITKEQACLLEISLVLADDIEGATTEDYGLSFCPNGKALPLP